MIEEICPVSDWQAGWEVKYEGEWLDIMSFRVPNSRSEVFVNCYDPNKNVNRQFVAELSAERRIRRPVENGKELTK